MKPTLKIDLHERQGVALLSPATEQLFGGAAGGGKSHLLRAAAIIACLEVPGLQAYLFRRLYPDLIKNHLEGPGSFHVLLAPLVLAGKVKIVDKQVRFWNGSKIHLCHLQHEKDVYSYQGQEIHFLLFDELTHFTDTMYRYLRGRCRLGGLKVPPKWRARLPKVLSGSNPGGVGHIWVKRAFRPMERPYTIVKTRKKEGRMLRQFIPSLLTDNPTMSENDPDYEDRLEGLGDSILIRAMRDGDWNIVAGSMYGDAWRDHLHVCDPFPIPCDWRIWRGGDDGFASPTSVHWITKDPKTGTHYVINELYKARMRPDVVATRVLARDRSTELIFPDGQRPGGMTYGGVYDNSGFKDEGNQNDVSRGEAMNKMGCRWERADKWPGSRVHRVQFLHSMLARNPRCPLGLPKLQIFRGHCPVLVETLPTLPRDPKDLEDIDTDAEDHAFDSLTYGLTWKVSKGGRTRVGGL